MWSGDFVASGEESPAVVCDAGPLIHLDQLGCLDALADLGPVQVPEAVWQEVERHRPGVLGGRQLPVEPVKVESPPRADLTSLIRVYSLDAGEAQALALLQRHRAAVFLTDDAAARLAAAQLGYEVHGTIGVLIRAIRRGLRSADQVVALLEEIPRRSTLYIRPRLLAEVIELVKASQK
jgi:predicted nucleic acid-binding protein